MSALPQRSIPPLKYDYRLWVGIKEKIYEHRQKKHRTDQKRICRGKRRFPRRTVCTVCYGWEKRCEGSFKQLPKKTGKAGKRAGSPGRNEKLRTSVRKIWLCVWNWWGRTRSAGRTGCRRCRDLARRLWDPVVEWFQTAFRKEEGSSVRWDHGKSTGSVRWHGITGKDRWNQYPAGNLWGDAWGNRRTEDPAAGSLKWCCEDPTGGDFAGTDH